MTAMAPSRELNPLDTRGLCLLSLDGGGVRGLSTLYILKGLMDQLNHAHKDKSSPLKKPCEVFDLMGGHQHRLIAIMLGRLEMDVDECITAYVKLMKNVFGEPFKRNLAASLLGKIRPQFDASKLEDAINEVINTSGANPTDQFNDNVERHCRVFVCSITQETKDIVHLRSYQVPGKPEISATICQAACATSAATTFFEPVSIGARRFADGALGANNPVDEVEREASDVWCEGTGDLKPLVKCFISIGTGNPGKKATEDKMPKFVSKTLPELATQTEHTEKNFIAKWRQHYDDKRYFRFNVDQGLQKVRLAEYKEQGLIEAATESYLVHQPVASQVRDCIQNLKSKQSGTDLQFSMVIKKYQRDLSQLERWQDPERWHVPFDRNPKFTGRKEFLEDIQRRLQQHTHTVKIAVIGLGGVGKTQLILELAYRMREQRAVFWIPVNNLANLQTAYYEVAQRLRLPGCEENGAHVLKSVQTYLSDERIGPWLLILDNADDFDMWKSPFPSELGRKSLLDLLPKSTQGSIIFTTRNSKVGVDLSQSNLVEVPAMDEPEATKLLESYLINKELCTDSHVMPILLKQLTYLPLAIVQAASYINKNMIFLSAYKDLLLWEEEESAMALLSQEFQDYGRYSDTMNAVATTWMISFQQICQKDSLAADYLCLMACVDPRDVPKSLLPQKSPLKLDRTNAIGALEAYAFLKKHSNGESFDIHPLVHLVTRGWLKLEGKFLAKQIEAVKWLGELLRNSDETNRKEWRIYISHAQYAVLNHSKADSEMIDLAKKCGNCLGYDGRYYEAETMYNLVHEYQVKVLGPEHPNTLISANNLGWILSSQGKYEEAETMHRHALRDREKVLGPEHPHTLTSTNNLGWVLISQGEYKEAETMHRHALRTRESSWPRAFSHTHQCQQSWLGS